MKHIHLVPSPNSTIGLSNNCPPSQGSRLGQLLASCVGNNNHLHFLCTLLTSDILLSSEECLTIKGLLDAHFNSPFKRAFAGSDLYTALAMKWPEPVMSTSTPSAHHFHSPKKISQTPLGNSEYKPPKRPDGVWRRLAYGPQTLPERCAETPLRSASSITDKVYFGTIHADDIKNKRVDREACIRRFVSRTLENVTGIRNSAPVVERDKNVQTESVSRCVHGVMTFGTVFDFKGDGSLLERPRNRTVKRGVTPNDGLVRENGEVVTHSQGTHGATRSDICQACQLGLGSWNETRTFFNVKPWVSKAGIDNPGFATVGNISASTSSIERELTTDPHWSSYLNKWNPTDDTQGLSLLFMAKCYRAERGISVKADEGRSYYYVPKEPSFLQPLEPLFAKQEYELAHGLDRLYRLHGPITRTGYESSSPSTPAWLNEVRADKFWRETAYFNFHTQIYGYVKEPRLDVVDTPTAIVQEILWNGRQADIKEATEREKVRFWRVADFLPGLREGRQLFLMQHRVVWNRSISGFLLDQFRLAPDPELAMLIKWGLVFEWQALNGGRRVNKSSKTYGRWENEEIDFSHRPGDPLPELPRDSCSQDRRSDSGFYDSKPWEREAVTLGRLCLECGAEIKKRKGTKYCSSVCQEKYWKKTHKEKTC